MGGTPIDAGGRPGATASVWRSGALPRCAISRQSPAVSPPVAHHMGWRWFTGCGARLGPESTVTAGRPGRNRCGGPGRLAPMSGAELLAAIRDLLLANPIHGEGRRKVRAKLRLAAVRTSKRQVLRLMRENALLAPGRAGLQRSSRSHDGTIIPDTADRMWGTSLTTTMTGAGQAAVFIAVDHCSAECVGIDAAARATRFEALAPIQQRVRQYFSGLYFSGLYFSGFA